nr:response regulator [uncultured Dyadobacter sp.]
MATERKPLTCIIVDDEMPCHHLLRPLVKAEKNLKLVASCFNAFEAMDAIRQKQPNLVFLDVNMPSMTGIEMLEQMPDVNFSAVVVTAYPRHQVETKDPRIKGFLEKPVSAERFERLIKRLVNRDGASERKL